MILAYGVTHEKWVWDIRGEPGVVDTFAKVYGDDDLIVSFDVVNVQFSKYEVTLSHNRLTHELTCLRYSRKEMPEKYARYLADNHA